MPKPSHGKQRSGSLPDNQHRRGVVRAHFKRIEDMPEQVHCCRERIEMFRQKMTEFLVMPDKTRHRPEGSVCSYCDASMPEGKDIRLGKPYPSWDDTTEPWVGIEYIDIDEGQPAASPVAGQGTQQVIAGSEKA